MKNYIQTESEDSKTLSLSCWHREQSILQLMIIITEILTSFFCRTQIETKIQRLRQLIDHVKLQEHRRQDMEMKIINKYYIVKTDNQCQRLLMFAVLQQLQNNYKKLGTSYENKAMFAEQAFLKVDVERMKVTLRQKIQLEETSVAEILQIVSQFSRQRLDQTLEIAEKNNNMWREQHPTETLIKRQKFKANQLSSLIINPNNSQRYKINSSYETNAIALGKLENLNQTERHVNKRFQMDINLNKFESSFYYKTSNQLKTEQPFKKQVIDTQPSAQEVQSSPENNLNEFILHSIPINAKKLKPFITRMRNSQHIQPSKIIRTLEFPCQYLQVEAKQYYPEVGSHQTKRDTFVQENYYLDTWNDIRPHSENDQRMFLYRNYKDLLRSNQLINQGIEVYHKNYTVFLKKRASIYNEMNPTKSHRRRNKVWWRLYERQKLVQKIQPNLDLKGIAQLLQCRSNDLKIEHKFFKHKTESN